MHYHFIIFFNQSFQHVILIR